MMRGSTGAGTAFGRTWVVVALSLLLPTAPLSGQQPQLDSTRNNYVFPEGTEVVPLGTLGRVERHGEGPVDMVLIPGHGFGGDAFRGFMEANRDRYTMWAVTLPGFGGTPPPPLPPDTTRYTDQIWTRAAADAVVRLIRREGMERPVVVGHFLTGGQIAMEIALDHPDLVRGAVVLAGEARRDMGSDDPAARRRAVDETLREQWFRWVTPEVWAANNWSAPYLSRDPELGETLRLQGNSAPVRVLIQYLAEFFGSDLPSGFDRLRTPLLVLTPGFDAPFLADPENAPARRFFIDSWEGMDEHPAVEIRSVEGARIFLWEDEPEATSEAIRVFVDGLGEGEEVSQAAAVAATPPTCPRPPPGKAALTGRVLVFDGSEDWGIEIELHWEEPLRLGDAAVGSVTAATVRSTAAVDDSGHWQACAVPSGTSVSVHARATSGDRTLASDPLAVLLAPGEGRHVLLSLGATHERPTAAVELAGLTVEVRRRIERTLLDTGVRLEALGDRFIGPDAIAASVEGAQGVAHLVERQNLPGIGVLMDVRTPCVFSRRYRRAAGSRVCARVVVDGTPVSPQVLSAIPPGDVASIAFLRAHEAGARWGDDTLGGILFIWTRGGGPPEG